MKRTVLCLVFVLAALVPSVAGAGGWAVASLDPIPAVRASHSADIGFVLLQHGQTPVVAAEWTGSAIGLGVRADGREWFVAAVPVGAPGHYVATVDVPSGVSELAVSVQMHDGLFVEEGWTDITAQGAATSAGAGPIPTWTVPLLALAAAGCMATIVVEVRSTRRRRDTVTPTPAA